MLKRYNHYAFCKTCDGDAQSWMEEEPDGLYALVSDVDATMIERPDAETIEVLKEIRRHYLDHATRCDGVRNQMAPKQKELNMYRVRILAALLKAVGVEVKP